MNEVVENKKSIHKAHERAFKSAMQDLRVAQDFFTHHLHADVQKKVDLHTLKLHRETFIDPELSELISDMLYSAEFKTDNHAKQRVFLYLCVEHQRKPEFFMPLRMLKYTIRAIDQHVLKARAKTLPLIIPMVVYNGNDPYPYSTSVFDLFGDNTALAKDFMFNQFQLVDLTQVPDEAIRQHQWSGFLETLMKHIDARNIMVHLEQISSLVKQLVAFEADEYVLSMIKYAIEKSEKLDRKAFFEWVQTHLSPPLEDEAMTLAEQLRAEGYEQGIKQARTLGEQLRAEGYEQGIKQARTLGEQLRAEGYEQGIKQARTLGEQLRAEGYEQGIKQARTLGEQLRAEGYEQGIKQARTLGEQLRAEGYQEGERSLLVRQLICRFGTLPSKYLRKLDQANGETILIWGERIFDAKNIEDVFAE